MCVLFVYQLFRVFLAVFLAFLLLYYCHIVLVCYCIIIVVCRCIAYSTIKFYISLLKIEKQDFCVIFHSDKRLTKKVKSCVKLFV